MTRRVTQDELKRLLSTTESMWFDGTYERGDPVPASVWCDCTSLKTFRSMYSYTPAENLVHLQSTFGAGSLVLVRFVAHDIAPQASRASPCTTLVLEERLKPTVWTTSGAAPTSLRSLSSIATITVRSESMRQLSSIPLLFHL